ncbi:hypothetical protein B9T33_06265 [Acinetobacter sp. ANC 5054]|uniref:hypothetical protein n=1 Tax=Acinetobacter sp. ANC 5054 TaxID=1977877 RepID=UPI000A34A9B3|nr:hypothetical protein [Acinetobacter sp. ANC 5054]OTG81273.1 hypothetical protein B9T33_06265 [Acinetobacter sp. ANC 5054]
MRQSSKQIIQRIGETDQLFLQGNTPSLALDRADLRLQLVEISKNNQEKVHFLQEAIVLLEQGRLEFDEMPMELYINLSLHLAKAYMVFFETTREQRYALITQQIMKPMSKAEHGGIYFYLAYASAVKQEPAMTRHWLTKYCKTDEFDMTTLLEHPSFTAYRQEEWFSKLCQSKMH